jgi:hypothetical protein
MPLFFQKKREFLEAFLRNRFVISFHKRFAGFYRFLMNDNLKSNG